MNNALRASAVSVIIPCRNERDRIEECLRSVLAQEDPQGEFEVIVADGMSDDGTRDVLARLAQEESRLRVIDNLGRIASTGLNAGIRVAKGAVIVRMDAHTEYASDYIKQCVVVLQKSGADNVGGPWIARGKGWFSRAIAAAFQSPFAVGGARGHDPHFEGPVDTVYLGCWPREVFSRVGCFDEELVRNQDDEHNLRLTRAGGRIWQSTCIKSWYAPRASLIALFRQYMQYGYWKVRVIQKHKLPASVRHLVPGAFVALLTALACAVPFCSTGAYGLLALLGVYGACVLAASCWTAARAGFDLLPVLPLVFPCYHLGYGYGFLRGIWDFTIWRKSGASAFSRLTRDAAAH